MLIVVLNQSSLVTNTDAYEMTLAVNRQIRTDVAPAWGLRPPSVTYLPSDPKIAGSAVIGIFDDADQAGDLGWHTEVTGDVVYGRVFAQPVLANAGGILAGALSIASVLSHEVCETALDSACDLWADAGAGTAYARELCDPVESDSYEITVGTGVNAITATVSNFVTPAWFDPNASGGEEFDYMKLLTSPFQVRSTGYVVTETEGSVSQTFGREYPEWRRATKNYPLARTARRLKQGTRH